MIKKSCFHPGRVWLEALCDFENELHEHVEKAKKDQLRFQDGRLLKRLTKRIKASATGKDEWPALFYCYRFLTGPSRFPGYEEARRLHGEEMKARGLLSAREYCRLLPKQFGRTLERDELFSRACSIASWMEAQTSFSMWLVFKDLRQAWRGDMDARARAIQALYLSQLPQKLLTKTKRRGREVIGAHLRPELGVGTNYDNRPWNAGQWKNILEQAARLTGKRYDCTELERWLWWCFPVFRRNGWNTREVVEAALRRFNELDAIPEPEGLRRHLMSTGLRIAGKKQKQDRTAPLAEFVVHVVLPDPETMWGSLGGFLTKKN